MSVEILMIHAIKLFFKKWNDSEQHIILGCELFEGQKKSVTVGLKKGFHFRLFELLFDWWQSKYRPDWTCL